MLRKITGPAIVLLAFCLAADAKQSRQQRARLPREAPPVSASYASSVGSASISELPSLLAQLNGTDLGAHEVELVLLELDSIVQSLLKARDVSEDTCTDGSFPSVTKPVDSSIPASLRGFLQVFRADQLNLCSNLFIKTLGEVRARLKLDAESDLVRFAQFMAARGFAKLSSQTLADFRRGLIEFAASKIGVNRSVLLTIAGTEKLQQMLEPMVTSCNDIRQALYPVDEIYFHVDWSTAQVGNPVDVEWLSYVDLCRGLSKAHVVKTIRLAQRDLLWEPIKLTRIAVPTNWTDYYNQQESSDYKSRRSAQMLQNTNGGRLAGYQPSPYQLLVDHMS